MSGTYISEERVERAGVLIAFAGEVMTEEEAIVRGLICNKTTAATEAEADADADAEPINFSKMKVADLEEYLEQKGIVVPDGARKGELVELAAGAE